MVTRTIRLVRAQAAGVESMSRVPMGATRAAGFPYGPRMSERLTVADTLGPLVGVEHQMDVVRRKLGIGGDLDGR